EEVVQRAEEETAETAFRPVGIGDRVALKQSEKKLLRQILSIMRSQSFAPKKAVNWLPVGLAKLLQRPVRAGGLPFSRQHDLTPACCRELAWRMTHIITDGGSHADHACRRGHLTQRPRKLRLIDVCATGLFHPFADALCRVLSHGPDVHIPSA